MRIYPGALAQIGVHEYAHHLLDHRRRIAEGSLARIDAEFEADFHAILNGVQIGEAPSAMYYFFKAVADIESYARTLGSRDYESGACRAANVEDIAGALGIAPIVLLGAVDGGGRLARNSPETLRETAERLRAEPPPAPGSGACGRVSEQMLGEAHAELARLAAMLAGHAGILFAEDTETAAGLGLGDPAAFELIRRLEAKSAGFEHLDGLAAQAISRLIQRVEYAGAEPAIAAELDRIDRLGSARPPRARLRAPAEGQGRADALRCRHAAGDAAARGPPGARGRRHLRPRSIRSLDEPRDDRRDAGALRGGGEPRGGSGAQRHRRAGADRCGPAARLDAGGRRRGRLPGDRLLRIAAAAATSACAARFRGAMIERGPVSAPGAFACVDSFQECYASGAAAGQKPLQLWRSAMYVARFSYDVLPVNRDRAIEFIRRELEAAREKGLSARLLVPLTRGPTGGPALQFEIELTSLDQLEQFRHRGVGSPEEASDWMHSFSEDPSRAAGRRESCV